MNNRNRLPKKAERSEANEKNERQREFQNHSVWLASNMLACPRQPGPSGLDSSESLIRSSLRNVSRHGSQRLSASDGPSSLYQGVRVSMALVTGTMPLPTGWRNSLQHFISHQPLIAVLARWGTSLNSRDNLRSLNRRWLQGRGRGLCNIRESVGSDLVALAAGGQPGLSCEGLWFLTFSVQRFQS